MWKLMGTNKRARKTLGSAVRAALGDSDTKFIYNVETGEVRTRDGRKAFLVSEGQANAVARAIGTVLVSSASGTPFPAESFMKLLALAGEPYVSLSLAESRKISEALREKQEAAEKADGESGPGVGENPA